MLVSSARVSWAGRFTDSVYARDSSLTLKDVRSPTLTVVCEACGRRERFVVAKLIHEHGDEKLTELLLALADARKPRQCGSLTDAKRYMRLAICEPLMSS
jgi:hypothetical protein